MSKQKINQSLEVHRVAVAARDIECAQDGFEKIFELNASPADKLYQPLLFGAVTSYCRPFTNNDGFGSLPKKWKKFGDKEQFSHLHEELFCYRNSVVAHSDITSNKLVICPPSGVLQIDNQSHIITEPMFAVRTPLLGLETIREAIELCAFQQNRMLEFLIDEIGERFSAPINGGNPFEFNHLKY